ncbi:MAG: L,D-transpeptidase family protein [Phenylobacterium sp.]
MCATPYALPALAQAPPIAAPSLTPEQADIVRKVLDKSESHGLKAYPTTDDPASVTAALLRYARDVHVGRMQAADFPKLWGVHPQPFYPALDLGQALADNRLGPWLDSLPPPYSGYQQLRKGLAKYREIGEQGGWKPVPEGPALSLGSQDPRVAALRVRLAVEDSDIATTGPFDENLQKAVMSAQRRFGLKPDGVVAAGTLAALNQPVGQRVLQIIANMERWRWLPAKLPATRVQVNSGAAIVTLFQDDRPVLSMKGVSGRVGDETPMLQSAIHSVVLNPPWNVPSSIATAELWPKERKNPGYLARNGFRIIPIEGGGSRLQQSSEQSALGRFKFDFDNPYGVYLHDTPSKLAFERISRQASHGCVRVEKPAELAKALLAADPAWSAEAIDAAIDKGSTVRAKLPAPVPVLILYWTAFAGADGQMHFRSDPYGWDRLLLQKVGVLTNA